MKKWIIFLLVLAWAISHPQNAVSPIEVRPVPIVMADGPEPIPLCWPWPACSK